MEYKLFLLLDTIKIRYETQNLLYPLLLLVCLFYQIQIRFGQALQRRFIIKQPEGDIEQQLEQLNIAQKQQAPQQRDPEQNQENSQEQQQEEGKWQKIEQPQKTVPLFMVDFEQCDSKKCTGKKMERFKLLTNIKDKKKKFKGVVLSAFGKKIISKEDLQYCEKYGVCVIDCSWNRIQQTRQFRYKHQRKLPFVTAGNPVNFGKPYQLSCVEAMATALCAIDYIPQAKYIMSKFGWSDGFWKQNPNILAYGKCQTAEQISGVSKENEELLSQGFVRNYDIGSDEDQEEEAEN